MRILLYAPPGYGKSRLLAKLAAGSDGRVAIFVRSHLEALQLMKYLDKYGATASLMFGRSALCVHGARTLSDCLALRERGICKAKYKYINKKIYDLNKIYEMNICPYEYLHSIGRQSRISIMPMSYLESQFYMSSILDLINDADLVLIDEAHNLLLNDLVVERDVPSATYCDAEAGRCLLLPILADVLRGKHLAVASASITPPFSKIFIDFLNLKFIDKDNIIYDNLIIDIYRIPIRYYTRKKAKVIGAIKAIIGNAFREYKRLAVFLPNKELVEYFKRKLGEYPVTDTPLIGVDHILLTYYRSPISEGVNLDLDAALLIGFPLPDIRDPWVGKKARILNGLGYSGWKYAYLFAAVSGAIQAIGRVMRGLEDRAKYVAAIDDRFWRYRTYMPRWFYKSAVLRDVPNND